MRRGDVGGEWGDRVQGENGERGVQREEGGGEEEGMQLLGSVRVGYHKLPFISVGDC